MTLETIGVVLGLVITLGTVLSIVFKHLKKVWMFFTKINSMYETLDQIKKEFYPNGGSSLKDALNRIENWQIRQKSLLRYLSNHESYGIYEADEKGLCIWTNVAYNNITGREGSAVLGNGWVVALHPSDRDKVFEEWNKAVSQGREFNMEFRFLSPEGIETKVHGAAWTIKNDSDKVIGYVGHIVPIK